jgi:hypothetical protein
MKMLTCAEDGDRPCRGAVVTDRSWSAQKLPESLGAWTWSGDVNVHVMEVGTLWEGCERAACGCVARVDGEVTRSMIDIEACGLLCLNGWED